MKLLKFTIFLSFLSIVTIMGQIKYDKDGNIDLKRLSEEDAKRIYGDSYAPKIFKTLLGDSKLIKESIIGGNKVTSIVFNYGSICAPSRLGGIADLVWNGLGYGFEFGPLAAGEVIDDNGDIQRIVSDSFVRFSPLQGDYSPDGTEKWGWLPKSGYVDPEQDEIARLNSPDENGDGKPDSWPDEWYSSGAGKYVWPAFLGDQATAPDEEVFFVVDDYTNREFPYYPFLNDSTKRGLGLDMESRIIQFNNPLAEDIIFLVYQITNASDKKIPVSYFGMHGDPHIGGSADYSDDRAGFVDASGFSLQSSVEFPQRARNMVYAWDPDQRGEGNRLTGYFGWKFLESPSIANNNFDDDFDGIIDESPENSAGIFIDGVSLPLGTGISDLTAYTAVYGAPKPRYAGDEDGDWDPERHDVGIDGIGPDSPNYPGADYGEGDSKPSQAWYVDVNENNRYDSGEPISDERIEGYKWAGSEPNFGLRDISESDQIGLTSFHAAAYTNSFPNVPANDPLMWEWLSAGKVDTSGQELLRQPGDNVFNFGTGPLSLERGETQRFSMCILFGNNLQDLVLNAETSTRILEADYRFAQPPAKPIVNVVPGDGKVTLYWDTRAEESIDPLTGNKDFLGYKIYRSRDFTFSDVYTITDGRGIPFLGDAFVNSETGERAQWHYPLDPTIYANGYHPAEYQGRAIKYYAGDPNNNTGLVHEFVDSSVTNGIKYYYAVVAYDEGVYLPGQQLPPTETQAVIQKDPITGELKYDVNTVEVIPGPFGSGIINAEAGVDGIPVHVSGDATGDVVIKVMDDFKVVDNKLFSIDLTETYYDVTDSTGITETITSKDTVLVNLKNINIKPESVVLKDAAGNIIDPSKYILREADGKIRGNNSGDLPTGQVYTLFYRYFAVYKSELFASEDYNPAFDGMKLYVDNDVLEVDVEGSKFNNSDVDVIATFKYPASVGNPKVLFRADWEVRFKDLDTNTDGTWQNIGDVVKSHLNADTKCPFELVNVSVNEKASYRIFESIPATRGNGQWDWGEGIILQPQGETGARTSYEILFLLPSDSVNSNPVLPKEGDIYFAKTNKPFRVGDKYTFETKAAKFESNTANELVNEIYVVPNPYVAYSISEEPGRESNKRGDRDLVFMNLPPTCTIRIYTVTGELVQTIEKNDNSSMAKWDLLSNEGQRIAYGIYIYHVDIPDVGEKIGRIAIIK